MSSKTKKRKPRDGQFDYGDVDMTDEEYLEAQNPKVRTTIFLDVDLIRAYKQQAVRRGVKYQTLIRDTLRNALDASEDVETRLQRLEQRVLELS